MKNETIEEAAEQFEYTNGIYGFKQGVKWQSKRMFTEEDMREAFEWGVAHVTFEEWLEQFKNKLNN
jgi:hypothetical protein